MARRARVIDRDKGYRRLQKSIRSLKDVAITAGVFKEKGNQPHPSGSGALVIDVAKFHEFGAGNHPTRPYLRPTFDENRKEYQNDIKAAGKRFADTIGAVPLAPAAERLGRKMVRDIKDRIEDGIPPPLASATIAAKGQDFTLIETGTFVDAITHKVKVK